MEIKMSNRFSPKYLFIFIITLFFFIASSQSVHSNKNLQIGGKKIVMVIASKDFKDEEYLIAKEEFEKAGAIITTASSKMDAAIGMDGTVVNPDILIGRVDVSGFDAVVFIGGIGVKKYWGNYRALKLAQRAVKKGKVVGAICWAPVILAYAGVLKGKRGTVANVGGAADILNQTGCYYTGQRITVDSKIVTANGPQTTRFFARTIIKELQR
jgi:protease I